MANTVLTCAGVPFVPPEIPTVQTSIVMDVLQKRYGFHNATHQYFCQHAPIGSLDDFANMFHSAADVRVFCDGIPLRQMEQRLESTKILGAWKHLQSHIDKVSDRKRLDLEADLDAPLPGPDRNNLKETFWNRHRITLSIEKTPADRIVDRLYKECFSRNLQVYEVRKAATLTECQGERPKRQKVANGLYVETDSDPLNALQEPANLDDYLARLHCLMMGYTMAASWPLTGPTGIPETRMSDPNLYCFCPYDTVLKYFDHCSVKSHKYAKRHGYPKALSWLQGLDGEERAIWTNKMRNSTEPLGTIIATTMAETVSKWQIPMASQTPPPVKEAGKGEHKGIFSRNQRRKFNQRQNALQGGKGMLALTNGANAQQKKQQQLNSTKGVKCAPWNKGGCVDGICPQRKAHRCNNMLGNGQVCNARHRAQDCKRE